MLNTGSYTVILDECHFKDLLTQHVTPPPATVRQYPSINCMSVVNWWKKINSTFAFSRLIETHVRFWILQCIVINMSNKFCRCMYMYFDTIYYLFYRLVQNLHSLEWVSTNTINREMKKLRTKCFPIIMMNQRVIILISTDLLWLGFPHHQLSADKEERPSMCMW